MRLREAAGRRERERREGGKVRDEGEEGKVRQIESAMSERRS